MIQTRRLLHLLVAAAVKRRTPWHQLVAMALTLLSALATFAGPDQVYLRDGQILEGRVLGEPRGSYLFQPSTPGAPVRQIPPQAVRFVLYDDPARADQALGISQARRYTEGELTTAWILPTRAFGRAILEAIDKATNSIWISAYHLSGSGSSPVREFYDTLQRKAREGVDVAVICEYGPGTSAHTRNVTYNFAQELARSGIRVRFQQERRILHKKMIILDGREVLLGSSNLTLAGTLHNYDTNVRVTESRFVARAVEDFRRLLERSKETPD